MQHLFCFGLSYTAQHLLNTLNEFKVTATKRQYEQQQKYKIVRFCELDKLPDDITHILVSIPPVENRDIVYEKWYNQIIKLKNLKWLGYLSTTSVYGDHQGDWVDENSIINPISEKAVIRSEIERKWLNLYRNYDLPIIIFRIAGIYGIGRNPIEKIISGEQLPIIQAKGKYFSRIHVEDLARILKISMHNPTRGEIYNIADDLPAENSKVVEYAYYLLGKQTKEYVMLKDAIISPMLKEFYDNNKRVNNLKIKNFIENKLIYSNYQIGLKHILKLLNKST